MLNIRTVATICAAFFAGLSITQAPAQAREECTFVICLASEKRVDPSTTGRAGAPLQLLPTAEKRKSARFAGARTATKRTAGKRNAKKRARTAIKKTSRRVVQRRAATTRRIVAKAPEDNVLRGADSVSLIAMLPWWRAEPMETIRYSRDKESESHVLTAADAWVAQYGPPGAVASTDDSGLAQADGAVVDDAGGIEVADAGEVNQIDLTLAANESRPPERGFLHSLIALLGGAVAAASAARFLFV